VPTPRPTPVPTPAPTPADRYHEECWIAGGCSDDGAGLCSWCGTHSGSAMYCCRRDWTYEAGHHCHGADFGPAGDHRCVVEAEEPLPPSPSPLPPSPSPPTPQGTCVESSDRVVDFSRVFVAVAGRDSAAAINAKLASPDVDAVVFSAGIYHLDDALVVRQSNFVVLGLGIATLIPTTGKPAIRVLPGLRNVRLASVLLHASSVKSPTLLDWGASGDTCEHCVISDLFTRVGGPDGTLQVPTAVDVFVHLRSGGIIGDNFWLWRADHTHHGVGTHPAMNPCKTGLIVDGNDVTMYGLAVEHTLEDMTIWNGDRGRTYFYQSELPYDVEASWGNHGYVGYRVADHVRHHESYGAGVYHYFRDHAAHAATGIRVPDHLVNSQVAPIGVYLNGRGAMHHVINHLGAATQSIGGGASTSFTCIGATRGSTETEDYKAVPAHDYTPPGVVVPHEDESVAQLQSSVTRRTPEL